MRMFSGSSSQHTNQYQIQQCSRVPPILSLHEDPCRALVCRSHQGHQRACHRRRNASGHFSGSPRNKIKVAELLDIHELCLRKICRTGSRNWCFEARSSITIR